MWKTENPENDTPWGERVWPITRDHQLHFFLLLGVLHYISGQDWKTGFWLISSKFKGKEPHFTIVPPKTCLCIKVILNNVIHFLVGKVTSGHDYENTNSATFCNHVFSLSSTTSIIAAGQSTNLAPSGRLCGKNYKIQYWWATSIYCESS